MVKRDLYLNQVKNFINVNIIKIITGIRRCGKSYFLKLIINELKENGVNEDNILLVDLELPQYNNIVTREQLDEIVLEFLETHEGQVYLFFDEIQKVKNWEISVNGYYKLENTDIYLTGSNSELISEEFATLLTGRFVNIILYPFSFNEFLDYKKELSSAPIFNSPENSELENFFTEYLRYGGFPIPISVPDNKLTVLNDLFSSVLYNDLVKRYNIRDIGILERIIKFLIENTANPISASSIYNYLKSENIKIGKNTVFNYLKYLEDVYFLLRITREDVVGKKEITGEEKFYLIDQGFYNSQLEGKQRNIGRIIENIVFLEFLRRGYTITIGRVKNYEVDFICRKGDEKFYVQVTFSLSGDKVIEREYRPFYSIRDNYPKYVISTDKFIETRDGIEHINLIKFLIDFI